MSQFLRNLVVRHRESDVSQSASHIVQPRPKSRFEADSNSDIETPTHTSESLATTMTSHEQSFRNTLSHHHTHPDNINAGFDIDTNPVSETRDTSLFQNGRRTITQIDSANSNKNDQLASPSESTSSSEQSPIQSASTSEEFNTRIQTILDRLTDQKSHRTKNQSSADTQYDNAFVNNSETINNITTTRLEERKIIPEQSLNKESKGVDSQQSIGHHADQRGFHQSGLLQTPRWLTEMQSGLNSRWRDMNVRKEPEPVINVTIGRVEVKAIQSEPTKQTKTSSKPSGIMSLDDYLKKRTKGRT